MAYQCLDCGNLFEEGEEVRWTESHGNNYLPCEEFYGCPVCRGAYTDAPTCKECGEDFKAEDLYAGFCEDCLHEAITYESFLEYAEDSDLLVPFMFDAWFEAPTPAVITERLRESMRDIYRQKTVLDQLAKSYKFMALIEKYIMEDDKSDGRIHFGEWLAERRKK